MSAPLSPHSASPPLQSVAWLAAKPSGVSPAFLAWASSIHGRKSAGARLGNVRHRLVRSPFGSIASTGKPARRASSIRITPRPVLPEPVMPTMTPWVVNESVAMVRLPSGPVLVRSCEVGSTVPPRKRSATPANLSGGPMTLRLSGAKWAERHPRTPPLLALPRTPSSAPLPPPTPSSAPPPTRNSEPMLRSAPRSLRISGGRPASRAKSA